MVEENNSRYRVEDLQKLEGKNWDVPVVPQELILQNGEDHAGNGQDDDDNVDLPGGKQTSASGYIIKIDR